MDGHVSGDVGTETDLIAADFDVGDFHVIAYFDGLIEVAGEYEHDVSTRVSKSPPWRRYKLVLCINRAK